MLFGALLGACAKKPAEPEEVLSTFLTNLRHHRAKPAWDALTAKSQAILAKRHSTLAAAAGKPATDPEPGQILFDQLGLAVLTTPESIVVTSPLGPEVSLRVSVENGQSAVFKMRREGSAWKIDLATTLDLRAPSDRSSQRTPKTGPSSVPRPSEHAP